MTTDTDTDTDSDLYLPVFDKWTDQDIRDRRHLLPTYTSLVLYGRDVTDDGIKLLEYCTELKELHLIETSITDKGMHSIGLLSTLKWLTIDDANVTTTGISKIASLRKLEGLQILGTKMKEDAFVILHSFPELVYLESDGCDIGDIGMALIAQATNLGSLKISAPSARDLSFMAISLCTRLSKFSFHAPLVSSKMIETLQAKLPMCTFSNYTVYRPEDKVIKLVRLIISANPSSEDLRTAFYCCTELLQYSPHHPSLHAARALISYRLGDMQMFRFNLANARDSANMYGQTYLLNMAINLLNEQDTFKLRMMIEIEKPEHKIAAKLLTEGIRPQMRYEPISALINKNVHYANDQALPMHPVGPLQFWTIPEEDSLSDEEKRRAYLKLLATNFMKSSEENNPRVQWSW